MEESDSWDCSFKGHTETRSLSDPLCSFRCTGLLMCCSSVVKSGVTDHIFGCISVINSTFLIESIFRLRLYVCTGMTIYLYGHFYSLNLVILLFFSTFNNVHRAALRIYGQGWIATPVWYSVLNCSGHNIKHILILFNTNPEQQIHFYCRIIASSCIMLHI